MRVEGVEWQLSSLSSVFADLILIFDFVNTDLVEFASFCKARFKNQEWHRFWKTQAKL